MLGEQGLYLLDPFKDSNRKFGKFLPKLIFTFNAILIKISRVL